MGQRQTNKSEFAASGEDTDAVFVTRDDVSDYNPEQILPELPNIIETIRDWLQPTAYDIAGGEYRKHISSHVAGTGAWLTSSDMYQKWLQSDEHGLLWIKGIPGSGKSVMAAKLINDLVKSNPGSPVLFFFFRQIIDANHEPRALLRDWMDQILSYSPPLQKQLKAYVEDGRSLESISMEDMWKHLRMAFASLPDKVFCVADALDEIDQGHEEFLKMLGELGHWRPMAVKILITSRPVPSVEVPLRKTHCLHLRLQETLVDADISTYVHYVLSKSNIPKSDWKVISDAVPGRANGLFLYAKLAMDAFLEPGANIKTVLSQLPSDLNALYTDLLNEHARRSEVPESIQRLILQSVTHATRPLRLLELAEMIRASPPDGFTREIKATKSLIRAACGPLLEILPDETVSVIHHSFTEYLKGATRSDESLRTGYPALQMGPTHTQLALQCLVYLQSGCLSSVRIDARDDIHRIYWNDWGLVINHGAGGITGKVLEEEVQLRLKYPLFEYAASNWFQHIVKSEAAGHDQTDTNAKIHQLFGESNNLTAWLQMRWPGRGVGAKQVTQLHVAAKTGLISYTKELLTSFDANVRDYYDRTPVWWAAVEGHAEVISILIEAGAKPDEPDNVTGVKPLHRAANSNHSAAVTALLTAGVDPLTPKTLDTCWLSFIDEPAIGQTALMYACGGHVEALEAFLPFIGDDIYLAHRALAWAADVGSSKVIARLLQHPGVDVNTAVNGKTALYRACAQLHPAVVATLLQAGADPNINCDVLGGRSLNWAYDKENPAKLNCFFALCDHSIGGEGFEDKLQTIFVLLMEAGVNIDYRTPLGETALHSAARSPVLVRLLLEAGADANVTNCFGTTPLHITHTIGHNSLQSIVLLVEQGHANINAVQADGRTPLHCLLSSQNEGSAEKFLEYNPNCNVIDNKGNNLLHILMEGYMPNLEIIKSLLKRGTDPNGKNYEGLTPLLQLYHVNLNYTQIIESFLEAGADINAVDRDGNSLFFRLLSSHPGMYGGDSHKYLTYLIDRGVSPSQRNFHGQTALHMAVECHRTKEVYGGPRSLNMSRLNFLISLNLDVKAVDYSGNSLLHVLALRSDNHHRFIGDARLIPLWKKLIDLGLDLEQKNHAGRTPLHILCTTNTRLLRLTPGKLTPIDFVISRVKNLDVPDNDGITPLHIAVTCGEKFAKKLIDAGANPLVYTHEGLIPLHLAARCRDSNNVGLLLGAMRKQQREIPTISQLSETDSISLNKKATGSEIVVGIDTKALDNCNAITPLFYACSSGRPETVALLLEAGADAKMGNIFEAFLEFEEECCLWKQPQPLQNDGALEHTSPLKLSDVYRYTGYNPSDSEVPGLSSNDTARLEEIIDMLINYRADLSHLENHNGSQQGGIINRAVAKNNDYTAACLKRVVKKSPLSSETEKCRDELTRLSEAMNHHQKEASIQALRSSELVNTADQGQGQMVGLNVLTRFLIRREYHLVEELGQLGANFLPKSMTDEHCSLYHLIRLGLASLVEKIGHREAELMLTKGDWHAFGDNKRPGLWHKKRHNSNSQLIPFILVAVQRELPNMDVVRLLVEKLAVDIHEIDASGECALFHVTRGYHWWHVHQALPYLLNAGVDIQLRNGKGQTPLHIALQGDDQAPGLYSWDAAKLLIERGADVNAVDSSGQSCLACARHNAEMIKLLIKYGAAVTPDSIFAAIDSRSAKVLRALLSGGMNPNSRRNKSSLQTNEGSQQSDVEPHEQFPLYYAAMKIHLRWQPSNQDYQDIPEAVEIVQVLLDHGADPFAKFLKQDTQAKGELNLSVAGNPFTQVSGGYSERTLLHEVLFAGCFVDIFLQLPDLDVHHQDTKGRTLLHMICENRNGPDHIVGSYVKNSDCVLKERVHAFQQLLSLGANLKAQDNFGRNVLHYMLVGEVDIKPSTCARFFAYTLQNAPDLLNQGDYNGETPLHYAMIRALDRNITGEAEMLLEAGADYMIISKRGDTLLHMLGRGLAIAVLRQFFQDLVGRGVDLNARNARGETALFSFYNCPKTDPNALYFNDVNRPTGEYAKPMLENLGGDFFIKDNKGRGLLHAAAGGDVERFQELMDMGLDPMMEDNSQQTAIDIAAACGNREILELFKKKKDLDSLL